MLIGHEVAHALWTPADPKVVEAAIKSVRAHGAPNDGYAKCLLNIVEDARIERLIQEKYPGLSRDFVIAYRELLDRDIFQLSRVGHDVRALPFEDRFNLFFKCGQNGLMQVPFRNPTEQALAVNGQRINTFADTVALACAICDYLANGEQDQDGDDDGEGEQTEGGESGSGQPGDGPEGQSDQSNDDGDAGNGEGQNGDGQSGDTADGEDGNGDARGESNPSDRDGADGENQGNGKPNGKRSDKPTDGKSKQPGKQAGNDAGKGRTPDQGGFNGGQTDKALSDNLGQMVDTSRSHYFNDYATAPKFIMDRLIVPVERVNKIWDKAFAAASKSGGDAAALIADLHDVWKRDNTSTVANMVKRFEQRKAADEARRTSTAKSGRLDTCRLAYYKTSEDLFLSMSNVADGKSHGLVMVVDWSGSMQPVLGSVLSQMLCLAEFCRKTGVPFEVYAFTDCVSGWTDGDDDASNFTDGYFTVAEKVEGALFPTGVRMIQLLRSGLTRQAHNDAIRGIVALMAEHGYAPFNAHLTARYNAARPTRPFYSHHDAIRYFAPGFSTPYCMSLNGTPLNQALVATADITEAFRKRTGAQIVNVAVLTDGEASTGTRVFHSRGKHPADTNPNARAANGSPKYISTVLTHGGREYPLTRNGAYGGVSAETDSLIRYIRERTGARVYGFYLMSEKQAERSLSWAAKPAQIEASKAMLDAEGSFIANHNSYDEYYIVGIPSETVGENFLDGVADANSGNTAKKIATAFVKGTASRNTSRAIMVRFADCFATGKPSLHTVRVAH